MISESKMKIIYLLNLLEVLKKLKLQFELGKETAFLISELLCFDIFRPLLRESNVIDEEELQGLISQNSDRNTVIKAQRFLLPLLDKRIKNIENIIREYNKKNNKTKSPESSSVDLEEGYESVEEGNSAEIKAEDGKSYKRVDIYKSYFSNSSLQNMMQLMNTGRIATPVKKYLTVCFLDLVGFSTMSEKMEPIEVVEILNYFFNCVNRTIKHHQGDIDKFIGDAMLIVFESAEDAVRCMIEILLKDLDIVNTKLDFMEIDELQVHLGINTGWIVQGDIGSLDRRETTVIGDGVNIAARVQGLSGANDLWITASTYASLGKLQQAFEAKGRQKLKGRVQEVMCYQYIQKVEGDNHVLLIEPNRALSSILKEEMAKKGIKQIEVVSKLENAKDQCNIDLVKVVAVGPSFKSLSIKEVTKIVRNNLQRNIPVIPILDKKLDKDTFEMFQKLDLKTYAPLYKTQGLEKLNNALINENVKTIPKIEKEPDAAEANKLVKQLMKNFKIEKTEEEVEKELTKAEIEASLKNKMKQRVFSDTFEIIVNENLNEAEIEVFKHQLENLWRYTFRKKSFAIKLKLDYAAGLAMENDFLNNLLTSFNVTESPKDLTISVDFYQGHEPNGWEELKNNFRYQFD